MRLLQKDQASATMVNMWFWLGIRTASRSWWLDPIVRSSWIFRVYFYSVFYDFCWTALLDDLLSQKFPHEFLVRNDDLLCHRIYSVLPGNRAFESRICSTPHSCDSCREWILSFLQEMPHNERKRYLSLWGMWHLYRWVWPPLPMDRKMRRL